MATKRLSFSPEILRDKHSLSEHRCQFLATITAMAFEDLREEYQGSALRKRDCANDPIEQFRSWFEEAIAAKIEMANAMTLATVDLEGAPQARIVLLKEYDERGFVFYTNYDSAKGKELSACDRASLLFYWHRLHRQIRIEGRVTKVDSQTSDAYFQSRPRASNIVAMASHQSELLTNRESLLSAVAELTDSIGTQILGRPEKWGGYRVQMHAIEFWQGQPDRTHDRIKYQIDTSGSWNRQRLAP